VLARELHWHLGATANQLRRRWKARLGARTMPPALVAWIDGVDRLAAPH
jgi:hypothetical protein